MLLDGSVVDWFAASSSLEGPLPESELSERIIAGAKSMEWRQAIEYLRLIRRGTRQYFLQPFGGGYHPFHLILLD
jgi:hypothetical protein